jgi:nitrogen regulatory protein PII
MKPEEATLVVVIIAEELRESLLNELHTVGVQGFSTSQVRGFGRHGSRPASFFDLQNLRVEMIVHSDVADRVMEAVAARTDRDAIIAYRHPVLALGGKF